MSLTLPVVILAGGLATRLRPLTETIPKSLIDINGRPFLWHQLRLLRANGVECVVVCVGHLGEMVRDWAGDGSAFGLHIEYSFDGPELRGTAGAVRQALSLLGESFFVLYGDSYLPCNWMEVEQTFRASGKLGLMTVCRNENRWDASNVEFDGGRIIAYNKTLRTPRMHHIDYGLGVFARAAVERFVGSGFQDLAALYQQLLADGQLAAYEVMDRFYEIGSPEGIREFRSYLSGIESNP